jgi:hypothetical protein
MHIELNGHPLLQLLTRLLARDLAVASGQLTVGPTPSRRPPRTVHVADPLPHHQRSGRVIIIMLPASACARRRQAGAIFAKFGRASTTSAIGVASAEPPLCIALYVAWRYPAGGTQHDALAGLGWPVSRTYRASCRHVASFSRMDGSKRAAEWTLSRPT